MSYNTKNIHGENVRDSRSVPVPILKDHKRKDIMFLTFVL